MSRLCKHIGNNLRTVVGLVVEGPQQRQRGGVHVAGGAHANAVFPIHAGEAPAMSPASEAGAAQVSNARALQSIQQRMTKDDASS